MDNMDYTEEEKDLIEQIRNYRRAYPNGAEAMEQLILATLYDLMDKRD